MENTMNELERLLKNELENTLQVRLFDLVESATKVSFIIDSISELFIEIEEDGVTVFYFNEHEEFWLSTYKNADECIRAASQLVVLLLQNTIMIEYVYARETLISYKIWTIDKLQKRKQLLKSVSTSMNFFLKLCSKFKVHKELNFKNQ